MSNRFVAPRELNAKVSTKSQLYDTLEVDFDIVLPPFEKCPLSSLKDVLARKKLTIDRRNAIILPVPRYKELSTKAVWNFVKEVPDLINYFPDINDKDLPDRAYMWSVLSTLRKEECNKLIEEERRARSISSEEKEDSLIEIHPDILDCLISAPLLSKGKTNIVNFCSTAFIGNGCVAYLLKKSRPMKIKKKSAKEYQANLQIFKNVSKNQTRKLEKRQINNEEAKEEEVDMNVDSKQSARPKSRQPSPTSSSIIRKI